MPEIKQSKGAPEAQEPAYNLAARLSEIGTIGMKLEGLGAVLSCFNGDIDLKPEEVAGIGFILLDWSDQLREIEKNFNE